MHKQQIIAITLAAAIASGITAIAVNSSSEEAKLEAVYTDDLVGKVQPTLLDPSRTNYILRMETVIGPVGERYFSAKVDAMRSALKKPECDYIQAATVDAYRSSNRDLTFGIRCRSGALISISESRENDTVLEPPAQVERVDLPPVPVIAAEAGKAGRAERETPSSGDGNVASGVEQVRETASTLCGALGESAHPAAQTIEIGEASDGSLSVNCSAL